MKETRTIKVWLGSYRKLKLLAALTGETLIALVDRLAQEEEKRLGAKVHATKNASLEPGESSTDN
jgi:hypothetical protein